MLEQIQTALGSHGSMALLGAVGILALFLAFKVARFLLRLLLILIALAAIGGAVWWFFLRV